MNATYELNNNTAEFIGHCMSSLKKHEKALHIYEAVLERRSNETSDPRTDRTLALSHENAGICLHRLERFEEAMTKFEIAKDICNEIDDPLAASTANWLGACFRKLKKYEHALKNFKEAIEKRQQKTDSMLASFDKNAGICLYKLERFEEAMTKFEITKYIYNEIGDSLAASTVYYRFLNMW